MPNQSIEELNKIIGEDPENANAYLSRGRLHILEGRYNLALGDFISADKIDPLIFHRNFNIYGKTIQMNYDDIESCLFMAKLYEKCPYFRTQEYYQKALTDVSKAINIEPHNSNFYVTRAKLYCCNNRYDLAESDLAKAIEIDSKNVEAYSIRSKIYESTNFEAALQDISKAIDLNPKDFKAYLQRSKLFESKIDYEKALHDADSAISLDPKNVELLFFRALLYEKTGRFDLGVQDALVAADLKPENKESYFLLARLYGQLEEYDQAIENITKAIEILEANPPPDVEDLLWDDADRHYNFRGYLFERAGKEELAIKDYKYALGFAPNNEGFRYLSKILVKKGKYSDALDYANKSLKMYDSNDADILELRGEIYAKKGRYEEAYKDLSKALKINKESLVKTANYMTDCIIRLQNREFDLPIRSSKNMLFEDGKPIVLNKKVAETFRTIIELYIENHKDTILLRENKKYRVILRKYFDNETERLFWNVLETKDKNDKVQIKQNLGAIRDINEQILNKCSKKFPEFQRDKNRGFISDFIYFLKQKNKVNQLIDRSIFDIQVIGSAYGAHTAKAEDSIIFKPTINSLNSLLSSLKDIILWFDKLQKTLIKSE